MNISRINASNIAGLYKKTQGGSQKVGSKSVAKDDVVLSENGKIFNTALKSVQDQPEVREAIISEVSKQIKSGEYKVTKEDLVGKLITNAFFVK